MVKRTWSEPTGERFEDNGSSLIVSQVIGGDEYALQADYEGPVFRRTEITE